MKAELFVIEPGVWAATEPAEVQATIAGLKEMGLHRLPYHHCTVRLPGKEFLRIVDKYDVARQPSADNVYCDITINDYEKTSAEGWYEVEIPRIEAVNALTGFRIDVTDKLIVKMKNDDTGQYEPITNETVDLGIQVSGTPVRYPDTLMAIQHQVRDFLIVMLATRNVRKTTTVDKLAKLGIGRNRKQSAKHRYTHVTTISLPRPEEMEDDHEHKATGIAKAPHLRRGHIRNQHYGPKGGYVKRIWIEPVFVNADPDFVSKRTAYNLVTSP